MSADGRGQSARARDAEARRLSQTEFGCPLVVEAGAGTGKTAALVGRILAWTLGPGWERAAERAGAAAGGSRNIAPELLRRVVAITFTEAAAAEMAGRVGEALLAIEGGRVPEWLDPGVLPPGSDDRRARARALLGALDQLGVRTIHAFCRRLLAEHPLEAGLHPHFGVDADEGQQKAIVREVVEQALPTLLASSDDLLRLTRAGARLPQIEDALLGLLRQGVPAAALDDDPLTPDRIAALRDPLLEALDRFLDAEDGCLAAVTRAPKASETAKRLRRLRERAADVAGPAELHELLAELPALWDGTNLDRLKKWSKEDFGAAERRAVGEAARAIAGAAERAHLLLRHLGRLDLELLDTGRRVLAPLLAEVEREMRARGVETFPGLLRHARDLLVRHPEVARRQRRRIDQLLVDEFQDTDRMQCEIVARLVLDAPADERPGLFIVGDPKQSIYGWRDADLAAYDDFVQRVEEAGGRRLPLVVNFRSAPPILAEVERLIAPVMHQRRGVQPAFEALLPAPGKEGDTGFAAGSHAPVEHWVCCRWNADEGRPARTRAGEAAALEAAALAADLARLHEQHGVPWQEIGLLFRGVGDLETYLAELRRAGIPFAVEGDRHYFQRREIIEAAALVRCVLDPNDQVALLAFLRSAAVGVPDAALIPVWSRRFPERASSLYGRESEELRRLEAAVAEAAQEIPPDVPGIERVGGWEHNLVTALRALAALRESFDEDPADVFVSKLRSLTLTEVGEAARYLGAYRVANLERFFGDLLDALRDGEGDPRAILRSMRQDVAERREAEEGRPKEAAEDAVQILTIHKAKGLAFAHVYVLQLNKGRSPTAAVRAEERDDGRFEYALFGAPTPGYARVDERRRAVEEAERVRTLYVALTRAEERLVVAGLRPAHAAAASDESHVALLGDRRDGTPDLDGLMGELVGQGGSFHRDAHHARWVFPGLPGFAEGAPATSLRREPLFDSAAVAAASAAHARRREEARVRMQRPLRGAVSEAAHEADLEHWREGAPDDDSEAPERGRPAPRVAGGVARAVGTAVHRALEHFDPAAPDGEEIPRRRDELRAALGRTLSGDDLKTALARADELWTRFAQGPLHPRLRALAEHVVARELPVLLPPADDRGSAPVGFIAGTVDLLYRDPDSAEWVVADYKTDLVESDAQIRERAETYAVQGAGYVRAVREALQLPEAPRFELWFLHPGHIQVVTRSAGPA